MRERRGNFTFGSDTHLVLSIILEKTLDATTGKLESGNRGQYICPAIKTHQVVTRLEFNMALVRPRNGVIKEKSSIRSIHNHQEMAFSVMSLCDRTDLLHAVVTILISVGTRRC